MGEPPHLWLCPKNFNRPCQYAKLKPRRNPCLQTLAQCHQWKGLEHRNRNNMLSVMCEIARPKDVWKCLWKDIIPHSLRTKEMYNQPVSFHLIPAHCALVNPKEHPKTHKFQTEITGCGPLGTAHGSIKPQA